MSRYKKELVSEITAKLIAYGYRVFVSGTGEYGFYTDGNGVVSFGSSNNFGLTFSGNYTSSLCGTGWQIAPDKSDITQEQAATYIQTKPPRWATLGYSCSLSTLEQHLKTYQISSKYEEVTQYKHSDY